MENQVNAGAVPSAYDYRLYDRIWRRVSPELNPYPEIRAEAAQTAPAAPVTQSVQTTQATSPAPAGGASTSGGSLENLPGADENPCCMGTQAQESVEVLAGFLEEEAADWRHYTALARSVRSQQASSLLRGFANEKREAVQQLRAAYFLVTGQTRAPAVMVEQLRCQPLTALLREVYHREACDGYNYERAADETTDPCLTKLFTELSKASFKRADQVMELLGKLIR